MAVTRECAEMEPDFRPVEVVLKEQRSSVRKPTLGMSLVRPNKKAPAQAGKIRDISETGIGLLLTAQIPVGTLLTISPIGWKPACVIVAEVIHIQEFGKNWLHGCKFTRPLTRKEFDQWQSYHCKPYFPN